MKTWSIIATWRMALDGVTLAAEILKNAGSCQDAVEQGIMLVENYPCYKSVGYGGLPNKEGQVELDAAFMDGKTLSIGAVAAIKDYKNPVSIARKLSEERFNILLVADGAEAYAHENRFERKNMLTQYAKERWELAVKAMKENNLSPYSGHDTVCMIALDTNKNMAVATSTSGLFMKTPGRVGDSPLSGSGFYADNEAGAAAATGLGEDIMKGCLSYETVQRMKRGMPAMQAAQSVVQEFSEQLNRRRGRAGAISVIAMDNKGEWGIGTNTEFSFAATDPDNDAKVYLVTPADSHQSIKIEIASQEYMQAYQRSIQQPNILTGDSNE